MTNFPFDLKVYVYRRPHMRDETLEMELYIGLGILRNLFDQEKVDTGTEHITLSFPERWCNIVEERSIYKRVERLYPNLKSLTIKTQSVYIIQCTPASCVGIVRGAEEQLGGPLPQEAETGRLWYKVDTIMNAGGLTVL